MKMKFLVAGATLCALGMTGCSNETDEPDAQIGKQVVMTMQTATDGPKTRADYTENGDIMEFSWRKGDAIKVVVMDANKKYQLTTQAEGKSAPFSGTVTAWEGEKQIYAIYPYDGNVTNINADGTAIINANSDSQKYTTVEGTTTTGAMTNSFMVGVGTATASTDGISASVSMKQVMSIIKLNITNAPGKVYGMELTSDENLFPAQATVNLNDATSTPTYSVNKLTMSVTDNTEATTKAISFAMLPVDLTGKTIKVTVRFEKENVLTIEKDGINFERNTHYVLNVDASTASVPAPDPIEVNGIKVAIGNLVANGPHDCKIGKPADAGLYFMFGSLIGWAGGEKGDGTGSLLGIPSYTFYAEGAVAPIGRIVPKNAWNDPDRWTGTSGTVPPEHDPCTHYLGKPWRLPTKEDFNKIMNQTDNNNYLWATSDWYFNTIDAKHKSKDLQLPAARYRDGYDGNLMYDKGKNYYWSSTCNPNNEGSGYYLFFNSLEIAPGSFSRLNGCPVRCVQDQGTSPASIR